MSTRVLIEMICDECSYVETFVYLETNQKDRGGVGQCIDLLEKAIVALKESPE